MFFCVKLDARLERWPIASRTKLHPRSIVTRKDRRNMYTHICVCTLCCDASNVRQTFSAARGVSRGEARMCIWKKSVEGGEMWFRSVARSEEESCVRKLRRKSLRSERLLSAHESQCRRWYLSKHDGGNVCVTPRIRASSRAETASEF